VIAPFFKPGFRSAVRLFGPLFVTSRRPRQPIGIRCRSTKTYAARASRAAQKASPRLSTAQAILASLLAKATIATFLWALPSKAFVHRPSAESRAATRGKAALAPWISSFRMYLVVFRRSGTPGLGSTKLLINSDKL
jgi:hypothetical protein